MKGIKKQHIVVIGGGFAGLNFARKIDLDYYDVTLIDRNNYHSFPPLFYQVASAGLDPASISFPLRRELRKRRKGRIEFNMGEVRYIDVAQKHVVTRDERVSYDILVIAAGTGNNFFNMPQLERSVYTLKSTAEALRCRNDILDILERASLQSDPEKQRDMLKFVVIGGGPTGVEIAGALGEMKRYVLPREYPSIPQSNVSITLVEGSDRLLGAMSPQSSRQAAKDLKSLMVNVVLGKVMTDYSNKKVTFTDGTSLDANMVIWTAGITGQKFALEGATENPVGHGNRFITDRFCKVAGCEDVYALGDISLVTGDPVYPHGHPQLAQVAIQQGRLLARNLNERALGHPEKVKPFVYVDKGTMATVGRNRAVVDMSHLHLSGFWAWAAWMLVHLMSLLGMRNKITVLINWIWAYCNYSTSLRLLIHPSRYPVRTRWLDD